MKREESENGVTGDNRSKSMGEALSLRANALFRGRTQAVDREAFEEAYDTYLPKIYNYVCYRVGDEGTAEDITSEVFERALTRLHTYRADRGAFSTWLFRIAHNMVANHLRDKSRRPETRSLESLPTLALSNPSPEEMIIKAEQLRQVQACMRELSEQQQEVLSLKFGAGLSYKEMGKAMNITPTYVGVLLHRAVHDLREALEKKGEIE